MEQQLGQCILKLVANCARFLENLVLLVRALEAELVGPYAEHEELDRAPSRTYLTGFLVPREDRNADPLSDPDDDTEAEEAEADGEEEVGGGDGERPAEVASRRPQVMPASLGRVGVDPTRDGG